MNSIMDRLSYIMNLKVGSLSFFFFFNIMGSNWEFKQGSSQICSRSLMVWRKATEDPGSRMWQ